MIRFKITIILVFVFGIVSSQPPPPLVFNFDTIEPVYINTSLPNNLWQIGVPQKTFFNTSFNGTRAIVTDTLNIYPSNNTSEFVLKTPTYTFTCCGGILMYFKHKFDTDTLLDGGKVEISQDSINWVDIWSSQALLGPPNNFYSSLNSAVGFSGHSNGWITSSCFWNYPISQFLFIKFKFTSDNIQNNKEGWMIDSLFFSYNYGVGIREFDNNSNMKVYPNPVTDNFTIDLTPSFSKATTATLLDPLGKILKQIIIPPNTLTIDVNLTDLSAGVYFLSLQTPDGNYIRKLVK